MNTIRFYEEYQLYYYDYDVETLNKELETLKYKLIEYLRIITQTQFSVNKVITRYLKEGFEERDIAVKYRNKWNEFIHERMLLNKDVWMPYFIKYDLGFPELTKIGSTGLKKFYYDKNDFINHEYLRRPDNILLLNFNYTKVADNYAVDTEIETIHIHGQLSDKNSVIFGYGDELDDDFKKIEKLNDNEYFKNVKSTCYMESDNYHRLLEFIESAPYQIFIMGHSCGNSDRTLLNTLFEHKNCISIKPFYYKNEERDNYTDIVQICI